MAVFFVNSCKFGGCGITFPTLGDLIQHIEDTHLDYDPRVLEKQEVQQPPCLPLSYILRFFTDAARKESLELLKKKQRAQSPAVSIRSTTPTGSEFDDDELLSESEDSNDSWTTQEEFSSEFILRYGSRMIGPTNANEEKPFACPVPGCKKRYKNVNGIKYHAKNGHRKDARVKKAFKCHCGKSYKTAKGLRSHAATHHGPGVSVMAPSGEVIQVSPVTPLPSLHPVTLPTTPPVSVTSALQGTPPNGLPVSRTGTSPLSVNAGMVVSTGGTANSAVPVLNSTSLPPPIGLPPTPITPGNVAPTTNPSPAVTPPSSALPVSPLRTNAVQAAVVHYNPLTPTSPNTPYNQASVTNPTQTHMKPVGTTQAY